MTIARPVMPFRSNPEARYLSDGQVSDCVEAQKNQYQSTLRDYHQIFSSGSALLVHRDIGKSIFLGKDPLGYEGEMLLGRARYMLGLTIFRGNMPELETMGDPQMLDFLADHQREHQGKSEQYMPKLEAYKKSFVDAAIYASIGGKLPLTEAQILERMGAVDMKILDYPGMVEDLLNNPFGRLLGSYRAFDKTTRTPIKVLDTPIEKFALFYALTQSLAGARHRQADERDFRGFSSRSRSMLGPLRPGPIDFAASKFFAAMLYDISETDLREPSEGKSDLSGRRSILKLLSAMPEVEAFARLFGGKLKADAIAAYFKSDFDPHENDHLARTHALRRLLAGGRFEGGPHWVLNMRKLGLQLKDDPLGKNVASTVAIQETLATIHNARPANMLDWAARNVSQASASRLRERQINTARKVLNKLEKQTSR